MGAHSLTRYVHTNEPLETAFAKLVDNERREYGNSSYSGTFATCRGVRLVGEAMGRSDAEAVANALFADADLPVRLQGKVRRQRVEKWGPALAIPVLDTGRARLSKRTVRTKVDSMGVLSDAELVELAHQVLQVPQGAWIENPGNLVDQARTKKRVARAQGKARVEYRLESRALRTNSTVYGSEREAVAAAVALLEREAERGFLRDEEQITIIPVRTKDGELTKVGIELVERRLKYDVEVAVPNPGCAAVGWFFFAMAAS